MNNVELFYSKSYEKKINKCMLMYNYEFPYEEVIEYINCIIKIPVEVLLKTNFIEEKEELLTAKDVFQFSNLDDATLRICKILRDKGNPGVTYLHAGTLLLDDGLIRKKTALIKYGENHLKTAEALGLLYGLTRVYFLSCLGYVIMNLSESDFDKLIVRLVLRNRLIRKLYDASKNGRVDVRQFLYMLSNSTYLRRKSNIKSILNILNNSSEYDFSTFKASLVWGEPAKTDRFRSSEAG